MTSLAILLHVLAAIVWVGGMFTIYVCLRPALATLERPADRLTIAAATFTRFFPWVWMSVVILFATGYFMLFASFGGFALAGIHVHIMHGLAWIMVALFAVLYWTSWKALRREVAAQNWDQARLHLDRIRRVISVNMPLGLIVAAVGASGRWWA